MWQILSAQLGIQGTLAAREDTAAITRMLRDRMLMDRMLMDRMVMDRMVMDRMVMDRMKMYKQINREVGKTWKQLARIKPNRS